MLTLNLNTTKNLLAFSGGIDSSALFHILLQNNIPFDIAIVDYNVRAQSKEEVAYAQSLAQKHNKQYFVKSIQLETQSNFEKQARDIRYAFFETLILKHGYETLITAHQLNDQLEWFLMQFSKGAGLVELIGFKEYEKRPNYTLYRPLLNHTKDELLEYLNAHQITYFIDKSNEDSKYQRNHIRKTFANDFLNTFPKGVKDSFNYLQKDIDSLSIESQAVFKYKAFELFKNLSDDNLNIRMIDQSLKQRGLLLTKAQRDEIVLQKALVVSHQFAITITPTHIWIAPYKQVVMTKAFKEKCRILKVPKNIRGYLFEIDFELNDLAV